MVLLPSNATVDTICILAFSMCVTVKPYQHDSIRLCFDVYESLVIWFVLPSPFVPLPPHSLPGGLLLKCHLIRVLDV